MCPILLFKLLLHNIDLKLKFLHVVNVFAMHTQTRIKTRIHLMVFTFENFHNIISEFYSPPFSTDHTRKKNVVQWNLVCIADEFSCLSNAFFLLLRMYFQFDRKVYLLFVGCIFSNEKKKFFSLFLIGAKLCSIDKMDCKIK